MKMKLPIILGMGLVLSPVVAHAQASLVAGVLNLGIHAAVHVAEHPSMFSSWEAKNSFRTISSNDIENYDMTNLIGHTIYCFRPLEDVTLVIMKQDGKELSHMNGRMYTDKIVVTGYNKTLGLYETKTLADMSNDVTEGMVQDEDPPPSRDRFVERNLFFTEKELRSILKIGLEYDQRNNDADIRFVPTKPAQPESDISGFASK